MSGGIANWAAIGIVALFLWMGIDAIITYFRNQHEISKNKPKRFRGIVGTIIAAILAKKAVDYMQDKKAEQDAVKAQQQYQQSDFQQNKPQQ